MAMATPSPRYSEALPPKNLRCLLRRGLAVGMGQPSEGDFRFLTPFGMTGGGFGMAMATPSPRYSESLPPLSF